MTLRSETEWRNWLATLQRREPNKDRYNRFYRAVCTENLIRVDEVAESPKLAP